MCEHMHWGMDAVCLLTSAKADVRLSGRAGAGERRVR